ncbi:alpha/beta hydrolase [Pseudonocardia halophobica]|uniref:alpha/beta hydrolase n=1 Tax=Pseudonocardia halophobica TaxID=29401 RepID=UPI003D90C589
MISTGRGSLGAGGRLRASAAVVGRAPAGDRPRGLPAAWIGVGTHDLFHDENAAHAERLRAAGVPCRLDVVPGADDGFDAVEAGAEVSRSFTRTRLAVLAEALGTTVPDVSRA